MDEKIEKIMSDLDNALEDVIIYQNRRERNRLLITLPRQLQDGFSTLMRAENEYLGIEVRYTHLDADKGFRIHELTNKGYVLRK